MRAEYAFWIFGSPTDAGALEKPPSIFGRKVRPEQLTVTVRRAGFGTAALKGKSAVPLLAVRHTIFDPTVLPKECIWSEKQNENEL